MDNDQVKQAVDDLYDKMSANGRERGYFLNSDEKYAKGIIRGLLVNEKKYGYQSCPCRLASGDKAKDADIICPCIYRDADVAEYGACVCRLYVAKNVHENKEKIKLIPERRREKA